MSALTRCAAALVAAHRSGCGLERLPMEPRDNAECFAIQDQVAAMLGAAIGGWKAGMPSGAEPYRAPMYSSGILASPATVSQEGRSRFGVEAEIAFRFGRALPPRGAPYTSDDVAAAIDSAHAAIELVESRYVGTVPYLSRLADNQTHGGFVFGPPVTGWRKLDIADLPVSMMINGVEVGRAVGGNPSGHPLRPVVWLANHLTVSHGGIAAGAFVTTGSTTGLALARAHAVVQVAFEGLGVAELTFVDQTSVSELPTRIS